MRIESVEVSGFRAFGGQQQLDVKGDIVIIVGANGQGKTSLLDAIHWALAGEISRFKNPSSVVSLFSPSGEARVELTIADEDNQQLKVTRHSDGQKINLLLKKDDHTLRGTDAEQELLRSLWPDGLIASESRTALRSALERGVYLQQDALTHFLTADTEQDRFNSIGELIGAGYTTEFQDALERSRLAWSRTTNERLRELARMEERLDSLGLRLRESDWSDSAPAVRADEWVAWWSQVKQLGVTLANIPEFSKSDTARAVDGAMADLSTLRHVQERRRVRLTELQSTLREIPSKAPNLRELRETTERAAEDLEAARISLTTAENSVEEFRRRTVESRLEQEDVRLLAEVALRHLGKLCPICQQSYDREATVQRLETMAKDFSEKAEPTVVLPDVAELARCVHQMEREHAVALSTLQRALAQEQLRADSLERTRVSLNNLGIDATKEGNLLELTRNALMENTRQIDALSSAMSQGEKLALLVARSGQMARRRELEQEHLHVDRDLETLRNELKNRQDTGNLVSKMIDGLRDVSSILVKSELNRLEPLLQRIYATADPHPEFRVVRLLSHMFRGRGRVNAEISDPRHQHRSDLPEEVLSSSQMNVLAVSVFLAVNLGIPTLPLKVAMLDDPIQSLDDLNLLGLIDLLKRMRKQRQLFISTHDSRLASLLERKLRPVSDSQRTILVEFTGWSREGPTTVQRDVMPDRVPIRMAVV